MIITSIEMNVNETIMTTPIVMASARRVHALMSILPNPQIVLILFYKYLLSLYIFIIFQSILYKCIIEN